MWTTSATARQEMKPTIKKKIESYFNNANPYAVSYNTAQNTSNNKNN